jgi:hypothetical protein
VIREEWEKDGGLEKAVQQIEKREKDPYSLVEERLLRWLEIKRRAELPG